MTHRTRPRATRVLLICLALLPTPLYAQQPAPQQQKKAKAGAGASAEADPLAEARRTTAISLVNSLADESRNYGDPVLRARVQARAADALWETDQARARLLFRRAWETAEAADKELGEARAREAGRRGEPSSRDAGSVRREVLRLAARRESALGQEFLKRLDESNKDEATAASSDAAGAGAPAAQPAQRIDPDDPPTTMMQRLNLARQLLEDGEVERATAFADAALYPVNTFGMNFLDMLRERDMKAADLRYAQLLARSSADPSSDANTVSLLAAYALTPYMYITVRPDGNSHTRQFSSNNKPPAGFDPKVRDAFLRTAAQILLRPLAPAELDSSSAGRTGTYVLISRLAPVFEQYAHPSAPQLRARQSALMQEAPAGGRPRDNELLTRGLVPEPSKAEQLQNMMDRLERAKTADERDMIYFRLAMGSVEEDMQRARDYALKVEDVDMRAQLLAALAYRSVEGALRAKRAEDAARLARADELTDIQRAYALTGAARLLAKDQPGRAVELLEEATGVAKKIDPGKIERAQALVAVATQLHALDRQRAWDMMGDVVKAANQSPEFTGEDGGLIIQVKFRNGGAMTMNNDVESFNLDGVFAALAKDDLNRAAELARGFTNEAARAAATLAVSRAVLVKPRQRVGGQEQLEVRR